MLLENEGRGLAGSINIRFDPFPYIYIVSYYRDQHPFADIFVLIAFCLFIWFIRLNRKDRDIFIKRPPGYAMQFIKPSASCDNIRYPSTIGILFVKPSILNCTGGKI